MSLPRAAEARVYYRAAWHRFDDANLLLETGRTTGAVYLAGYTVECMLKALVLASAAPRLRAALRKEFHGQRAHNIEWLGALYRKYGRATVPRGIARQLARLAAWSTDLRYETAVWKARDAEEFVDAVVAVAAWADGRM